MAAALARFYLFEGQTLRHLLISVGYILFGLTALGAILARSKPHEPERLAW